MKRFSVFAASLLALAAVYSCNKADQAPDVITYDITIDATVAPATKGLALSGNTLNAVWASGDAVIVYDGTSKIGTLTPQSTGSASTSLKGTVTTSGISAGKKLTLLTPRESWLYSGQDGTLSRLAKYNAYAMAEVTVSSVSGSSISTNAAAFENQQAIVKFTLQDDKGAALNPDELEIEVESNKLVRSFNSSLSPLYGPLSIEPSDDTNVIYVALRNDNASADTYTLTATVGKKVYKATKSGLQLKNGKYYGSVVKMQEDVHTYTVAGAPAAIFGTEWDATNTANDMVKQSDGTYLKVYNVTAVADVAFKVVMDHDWGSAGVNNWPLDDVSFTAGVGELKVMFDPESKKVTYTCAAPGAITETYTVCGAPASVFGTEWDPSNTANDMVKQSDGNYTKTYSNVPAGTEMQFKVAVNHAWTKSYGYNGGSGNASYTMQNTGTLTIHFNVTNHYVTASEN